MGFRSRILSRMALTRRLNNHPGLVAVAGLVWEQLMVVLLHNSNRDLLHKYHSQGTHSHHRLGPLLKAGTRSDRMLRLHNHHRPQFKALPQPQTQLKMRNSPPHSSASQTFRRLRLHLNITNDYLPEVIPLTFRLTPKPRVDCKHILRFATFRCAT